MEHSRRARLTKQLQWQLEKNKVVPILKIGEVASQSVCDGFAAKAIVVPAQQLLSLATGKPNKRFQKIVAAGGLHPHLRYEHPIILSLVMKDELIAKCETATLIELIRQTRPDFFTTPDGETYDGEPETSRREINRMLTSTDQLLAANLKAVPIGHIKGCNTMMIDEHQQALAQRGIDLFFFHLTDFLRGHSKTMTNIGIGHVLHIKQKGVPLLVQGCGWRNHLRLNVADGIVTNSHLIAAIKGINFEVDRHHAGQERFSPSLVRRNYEVIVERFHQMKKQKTLTEVFTQWEEAIETTEDQPVQADLQART